MEFFVFAAVVCFVVYLVGFGVGRATMPKASMTRAYTVTVEGKRYDVSAHDFQRIVLKRAYTRGSMPEALWQAVRGGNYDVTDWVTTVRN